MLQHDPAVRLREDARRLESMRGRLAAAARPTVETWRTRVEYASARLEALSPLGVLQRGYALVYGPDGRLLRASAGVREGERITARLAEGQVTATVVEKK